MENTNYYSQAQSQATQKYQAEKLEQVRFWVKKGTKAQYETAAQSLGMSLAEFLRLAISEKMERMQGTAKSPDRLQDPPTAPEPAKQPDVQTEAQRIQDFNDLNAYILQQQAENEKRHKEEMKAKIQRNIEARKAMEAVQKPQEATEGNKAANTPQREESKPEKPQGEQQAISTAEPQPKEEPVKDPGNESDAMRAARELLAKLKI